MERRGKQLIEVAKGIRTYLAAEAWTTPLKPVPKPCCL